MKILLLIIALIILGCAQSTHTFDPTQEQKIVEEIPKQSTVVKVKSGMDCYDMYKLKVKYCTSRMDCRRARRDLRRLGKTTTCSLSWSKNDIHAIKRQLERGR